MEKLGITKVGRRGEVQETEADAERRSAEKRPVVVKHGGTLLSLPFLLRYGIESILFKGVEERNGRYGFRECVFSLLLLLTPRLIRVEENIKPKIPAIYSYVSAIS